LKKIVTIIGARPQFIKASIVSKKLKETDINEIVIHTGQHYDFNMSDVFFDEFEMTVPEYHLDIGSGRHGEQTGRMLIEIERVLLKEAPGILLVYGDTNTTLASALAAAKLRVPVSHVEAGLRSFNKKMPEEVNRVLTDHLSELLFVPTEAAVKNRKDEGISKNVFHVGDVMFDLALHVKEMNANRNNEILGKYGLSSGEYILVTIHRADNTDVEENLRNIWDALICLANNGKRVFFPVHPRTKKYLSRYGLLDDAIPKNLTLSDPVPYTEMIILESNSRLVVTDSGGVQKESYFFRKPAVITREETEWVDLVEAGWNVLAGVDRERIINSVLSLYNKGVNEKWISLYGEGDAADKIVRVLDEF
jgi:UDP-GlcNAc3NAcA epimerase